MTTQQRVIQVFCTVFGDSVSPDGIRPSARLIEDVGIQSIGMLYMAMALEREFGIRFVNEDLTHLVTVQDVVDCIENKLS